MIIVPKPIKAWKRRKAIKILTSFLGEYIFAPRKERKEMAFYLLTYGSYMDRKYSIRVDWHELRYSTVFTVEYNEEVESYMGCLVISRGTLSRLAGTTIELW